MNDDKRADTRFAIQAVDFATVRINGDYILLGSITNVCQAGLHLELFPASPENAPKPGDSIIMQSCPKGLDRLLNNARGSITWIDDQCCGIKLDSPLKATEDQLERYFYKVNLSPWERQDA